MSEYKGRQPCNTEGERSDHIQNPRVNVSVMTIYYYFFRISKIQNVSLPDKMLTPSSKGQTHFLTKNQVPLSISSSSS